MALSAKLWFMVVPGIDYQESASPSTLLQVPRTFCVLSNLESLDETNRI